MKEFPCPTFAFIKAISVISLFVLALGMSSCKSDVSISTPIKMKHQTTQTLFGTIDSQEVTKYTLSNELGTTVSILNYGGIIQAITLKDKSGTTRDVVQGYDTAEGYMADGAYFGALTGRYANRIAGASITIDNTTYKLEANDGTNTLHGGIHGFHKKIYELSPYQDDRGVGVIVKGISEDGEGGFPGNLSIECRYLLTEDNELIIDYTATTDKPTVINLTNHSYFNLGASDLILNHKLLLHSDAITPVNDDLIPSGAFMEVTNTPFDFRNAKRIGQDIEQDHPQLILAGGYDHNFILSDPQELKHIGTLSSEDTGIVMDAYTTEPAVQLYTGNFTEVARGKNGKSYTKRSGICLETQHFPDSPHHSNFPSTALLPGETFKSTTIYKFSVKTEE